MKYRIDVENDVSLKSDNTGIATSQYGGAVTNRLEFKLMGLAWQPQSRLLYTLRDRSRADGSEIRTRTLDASLDLNGSTLRTGFLGDVTVKGTYGYRKQSDEIGSDIRKLVGFDLLVSRSLVSWLQVSALTVHKWETASGTTPEVGSNEDLASMARPLDHKVTYRGDLRATASSEMSLGVNFSLVSERISTISQFGLSLSALVPYLNAPLTSSYSKTLRDIGNLPRQSVVLIGTELSYNWRQIVLTLEHEFAREELVNQTFTYFEVMGRVTRRFGQ
jgi:hypothetical protein